MSIASRIESMYDHVGEVYDTITNVELPEDKNIENIPNAIKDSYLKIMNEGYQEIWDNWDKREATITDGTINGTEEAPMSLVYKGNTYQYTADIAGKNLFNFNSTSRTHFGTLTISDDTLSLAGGADAAQVWWGIDVSNYTGNITISYSELTGATMHESDNKLSYCFMSSIPTNWSNMGTLTDVDKTNKYATTALGGGNYLILVLQAGAGNSFVDGWASVSEVQVELGSTPTSYERFVGATPTPSLPSPVQVVSGDNTIKVFGKNLINVVEVSRGVNSSGVISGIDTHYLGIGEYVPCKPSTTYTITFQHDISTLSMYIGYKDIDGNFINRVSSSSRTFTTPNNAYSMYVYVYKDDRFDTAGGYVQLEYGTSSTPYEAYKSASYPISLGVENLFPSGLTQRDTTSVYTSSIPVMPKTTYSIDTSLSNLRIFNIYQDADKNTIDNTDWMNIPTTFTTINGCYYLQIVIGKTDSSAITTSEVEGKIDLTKGTTPQRITNNPIELCKIGDYQDSIVKDNGKWYLNKQIGKVVLNGSETGWVALNPNVWGTNGYGVTNTISNFKQWGRLFSDYFKDANISSVRVLNNGEMVITAGAICLKNDNTTTLEDFKTWLSTHNTIVYYPLATPITIEITDTTLLSQLEEAKKSYEGQTNITQTNNDLPFELDVVALSDGTTQASLLSAPLLGSMSTQEEPETLEEVLEEPEEEENDG